MEFLLRGVRQPIVFPPHLICLYPSLITLERDLPLESSQTMHLGVSVSAGPKFKSSCSDTYS